METPNNASGITQNFIAVANSHFETNATAGRMMTFTAFGSATNNYGTFIVFEYKSSAEEATLIANGGTVPSIFNFSVILFSGFSTAARATLIANQTEPAGEH